MPNHRPDPSKLKPRMARHWSDVAVMSTAERFADEWAGDNRAHSAIVEDLDNGELLVMDYAEACQYIDDYDAHIIYDADHREEDHSEDHYGPDGIMIHHGPRNDCRDCHITKGS